MTRPDAKGRDRAVIRVTVDVPCSFRPDVSSGTRLFLARDHVLEALDARAGALRAARFVRPAFRPRRYMRPKIHAIHEVLK